MCYLVLLSLYLLRASLNCYFIIKAYKQPSSETHHFHALNTNRAFINSFIVLCNYLEKLSSGRVMFIGCPQVAVVGLSYPRDVNVPANKSLLYLSFCQVKQFTFILQYES